MVQPDYGHPITQIKKGFLNSVHVRSDLKFKLVLARELIFYDFIEEKTLNRNKILYLMVLKGYTIQETT